MAHATIHSYTNAAEADQWKALARAHLTHCRLVHGPLPSFADPLPVSLSAKMSQHATPIYQNSTDTALNQT